MGQKEEGTRDFQALVNRYLFILREKGCTKSSIQKLARMTELIGQDETFDATRVSEVLASGRPTTVTFLKKLREFEIIVREGRGTYRYNQDIDLEE